MNHEDAAIIGAAALFLFLRLIVSCIGYSNYWVMGDSLEYMTIAKSIRNGEYVGVDGKQNTFRTPGYPAILAALAWF